MQEKIVIEMLNLEMDDETIQKVTKVDFDKLKLIKKKIEKY